ncbi:hypothetical protein SCOR_22555 [Sulfidibacter corallicola]|uniref:Uncharacterized protein n=1 Tax=Sulfidibacter corallicola TaxID=2818388 RepID=A0A8A4TUL0_SULCO|nr:hypothetical protein [Sulfidibacter corallicola]QTD52801.1 hypothetical protein J3U87_10020 [Sulfidibacter corallicola]
MNKRLLLLLILLITAWILSTPTRTNQVQAQPRGEPKGTKESFKPSETLPADTPVAFPTDI